MDIYVPNFNDIVEKATNELLQDSALNCPEEIFRTDGTPYQFEKFLGEDFPKESQVKGLAKDDNGKWSSFEFSFPNGKKVTHTFTHEMGGVIMTTSLTIE